MVKSKPKRKEIHIVKRRGHKEKFDERKAYASVYSACLASHHTDRTAEKVAATVCKNLRGWIKKKKMVSSHQIHVHITKSLKKHDKNASFMYETHMDIS